MTTQSNHRRFLSLLGLGLLAAGPAAAQVFYSNGATVFVNTGGALYVNGAAQQAGAATLRTTGTATVAGSLTSAAASTLDLSSGTLSVTGDVAHQGTTSGSTGTLRLTGTGAQSLGVAGGTVPNLTVDKASGTATLSSAAQVRRVLTLADAGNLATGGNSLTLLSDASGTALAVNSGTGVISGSLTVQRYIDGSLNAGLGYRHFSAPVSNTTVADLTTSGFTPTLTQGYNTSATPGTTTPFPTVFGYDQSRLASATNNLEAFAKGFVVPQSTDALTPGQGYAVSIDAGQLVDFVGTAGTGSLTVNLSRGSEAAAGWALVGNPYPAPLDYSQVAAADRAGLDAAVYVVQSSGQYTGGYRAYVNGQSTTGTNSPLIASSQGFFVRVSQGQTSGSLTFRNAQRVRDYATAQGVSFQRTTADTRPALRLTLAGNNLADGWVTYAEAGATAAFEGAFDATKLPNSHGLNLSSAAGAEQLAIDGRPAFTATTVLPLAVGVPTAGTYALTAAAIDNLPAGLTAYLRDALTGTTTALTVGQAYSFGVSPAQAQALLTGRFTVQFAPSAALATAPAALAAAVQLYPNPAREQATVVVPGLAGASAVRAELLNALGQVVRRQAAALPASGTTLLLPTAGLPTGVYVLRLSAGDVSVTKRLTIQ